MPRDSNGVASTDPVYLAVTGETIRAVQHNTPIEDIISMLTGSLARNGTGGMQANLAMGGFKISGIANATLATDAMAYGQLGTALASGVGTVNFTGAISTSGIISPAQITASQNDYAPTGFDGASVVRLNLSAAWSLTGLVAPTTNAAGRIMRLINISAFALTLVNESASSTAANRFALTSDLVLPAYSAVDMVYDATSSRWRALAAAQSNSANLPGSPTTTTQSASDDSTKVATTAQVHDAIINDLNASGSAPLYACRAWCKFSISGGVVTVSASGNVASVVRTTTGVYTVTFTTALQDANYCIIATSDGSSDTGIVHYGSRLAASFSVSNHKRSDGGPLDPTDMSIIVVR